MILDKITHPSWHFLSTYLYQEPLNKYLQEYYEKEDRIPLKVEDLFSFLNIPLKEVKVVFISEKPFRNLNANATIPIVPKEPYTSILTTKVKENKEELGIPLFNEHTSLFKWNLEEKALYVNCSLDTDSNGNYNDMWLPFIKNLCTTLAVENPCIWVNLDNSKFSHFKSILSSFGTETFSFDRYSEKTIEKIPFSPYYNYCCNLGSMTNIRDIFKMINKILIKQNKKEILWNQE